MFNKLNEILKRYEFLSEELAKSEVIADMSTWQKYSKEQADLTETADAYKNYLAIEKEMNDAFEMAELETDLELRKMLTDEGYDCKERLATLKDELNLEIEECSISSENFATISDGFNEAQAVLNSLGYTKCEISLGLEVAANKVKDKNDTDMPIIVQIAQ